ncbi:hypothetical protein LTR37_015209 [Vermiconidia calcicola]|uniref:Uncharacterized protein n=1 Tax=Vermiconidia calcicola TaxID=1690605 RepID=A0ACC3MT07_9PEZI|nr:hypothetical protein LTR37_015209 [Vermiconidia calcicola]
MLGLTTLAPAALLLSSTFAAAVKHEKDFAFVNKPNTNSVACPQASGTIFEGPHGGRWGILCGWDTKARKYKWGPFYDLTFQQCVEKCGATEGCSVATYTGACYLKEDAKGKGYVHTRRANNMAAVKLARKKGKKNNAGKNNNNGEGDTLPKQGNGPARGQGTKRSADEDGEAIYPRGDGRKPKHGHGPVRGQGFKRSPEAVYVDGFGKKHQGHKHNCKKHNAAPTYTYGVIRKNYRIFHTVSEGLMPVSSSKNASTLLVVTLHRNHRLLPYRADPVVYVLN